MVNSAALNKESFKKLSLITLCGALAILALQSVLFEAVETLKITAATATSLYWALYWIGWGATVASIVASFGLSSILAGSIFAAVKKMALKTFIKW